MYNFKSCGENIKIFPNAVIINPENIILGNNVKIDDFVYLSAGKKTIIGDYIHITSFSYISGGGELILENFCSISAGVKIFTGTDDFNDSLVNPTIPSEYRFPIRSYVNVKKHAVISTNCVILPGVTIGEGAVIGANSLILKDCEPWTVYVGSPARPIKIRSKDKILDLEKQLLKK